MAKDISTTTTDEDSAPVQEAANRSSPKKVKRGKAPKRVLKSEREKLKREHLNDLFGNLASVLELSEPNNGKACILGETIRLVNDIHSQLKSLREENAALLSESHYVTTEKNELKDENSTLKSQIEQIQQEIAEKETPRTSPEFSMIPPPECWPQMKMPMDFVKDHPPLPQFPPHVDPRLPQQPPILGPVYMIPVGQPNPQAEHPEPDSMASKIPTHVSKPHPRYPSAGDSWSLELLKKQAPETEAAS